MRLAIHLGILPVSLAGLLLLLPPGTAGAAPEADSAKAVAPEVWAASKEHFKRGVTLFKVEMFADAEAAFLAAYNLSRAPDLLFNLARAVERQGRRLEAASYLDRYVTARPEAPDREKIRARIEELRHFRRPAQALAAAPLPPLRAPAPLATAEIAPQPPIEAPPPVPTPAPAVAPPPISLPGLGRDDAPLLVRRTAIDRRPLGPPLGLLISGAVLLLGAGGAGTFALLYAQQLNSTPAGGRFDRALYQTTEALTIGALAAGGLGAAGLIGGAVWLGQRVKKNRAGRLALVPQPGGVLVLGVF